jgi:hypothetical protein
MKDYQFSTEVNSLFDQLDAISPQESACKKSCKDNYIFCKNSCWDHKPSCLDACRSKLSSCLDSCYGDSLQGAQKENAKALIEKILNALKKEDQPK